MSWHYLRGQEGESSEDVCSGGEPCAPLKSKITHAEFYCNGKLTESYLDSLSGMTFAPLTDNLGAERSMSSAGDSPAKTSAPLAKAQESQVKEADFGKKWRGSLAKYDHITYSWKTHQYSLLGDSELFSGTWPRWGTMLNGECWELLTQEHLTKEKESGLPDTWPTPPVHGNYNRKGASAKSGDGLATAVYQTPVARMWKDNGRSPSELNRNSPTLASQVCGSLNPTWVEWLMGWPIGWTDLKPLAMVKFQQWQNSHGKP